MSRWLSPQPPNSQGTVVSTRPNLLKPWSPQTQKGSQEKGVSPDREAGLGWNGRSLDHPWAVYFSSSYVGGMGRGRQPVSPTKSPTVSLTAHSQVEES